MTTSKSERTKQFIIEKAAPVFNKKGYADTSMMDIVEVTGLTKGSIYGNFENKDELAIKVFEYNLSLVQGGVLMAANKYENALDKLYAITQFYRNEFKAIAARGGCAILNAATEADDNFPMLKAKVKGSVKNWKKHIVQIIELGKQQKCIGSQVDAEKYALLFIALIEGGVLLSKITDDIMPVHQMLDKIDELIQQELMQ